MVTVSHKRPRRKLPHPLVIRDDVPVPDEGKTNKPTTLTRRAREEIQAAKVRAYDLVIPQSMYRLHELEPGQSVFVGVNNLLPPKRGRPFPEDPLGALAARVRVAVAEFNKRLPAHHYLTRITEENGMPGLRVWRKE